MSLPFIVAFETVVIVLSESAFLTWLLVMLVNEAAKEIEDRDSKARDKMIFFFIGSFLWQLKRLQLLQCKYFFN
jgi:hypothetical protein